MKADHYTITDFGHIRPGEDIPEARKEKNVEQAETPAPVNVAKAVKRRKKTD